MHVRMKCSHGEQSTMKNTTKEAFSTLDSMNRHFLITGVIADLRLDMYKIIKERCNVVKICDFK